ncbi:MAG: Uma2 family endonuclease [Sporichthyaceae bacterium]
MTDRLGFAPRGPLTVGDLEAMPDDGRRYELIDGMLFVSLSPVSVHQRMSFRLAVLLDAACPPKLEVFMAPLDVQTAADSVVQPDVLVARVDDIREKNLPVAPLLAAEVLSPSTRLYDRNTKKAHHERMGAASYWLLDPSGDGAIEGWELDDGGIYRLFAAAEGEATVTVERPFPLTICPAHLLAGRRPT